MTSATMRSCINRVAVDCAPLMPSISGSITSSIFPSPGGTAAFENRSLAARSSASSNGAGIGGGGGLGAACVVGAACGLGAACGRPPLRRTGNSRRCLRAGLAFAAALSRVASMSRKSPTCKCLGLLNRLDGPFQFPPAISGSRAGEYHDRSQRYRRVERAR